MKKVLSVVMMLALIAVLPTSCDLVEEIEACVEEFAEYEDRFDAYKDIEGDICENQDAANDFLNFLENDARGTCVEETLEGQGTSLDDVIAEVEAELAACTN